MVLTEKQQQGLQIIIDRYKNRERYTVISGYAGTGKTTLIRIAMESLGMKENDVGYAAPTGKAAIVMRNMGNENAMTIHRLLYDWYPRPNGKFARKRKEWLPYKIVVVDEVSMITQEFIDDLLRHKESYFIFLGDPFQLPCIDDNNANHLLDTPHVFLDEIMRQENGNDIVDMTMNLRQLKGIPAQSGKNYKILTYDEVTTGVFGWADQVICATNAERRELNKIISAYHHFTPGKIEEGQKVICNRNYWEIVSVNGQPLVNGTIGTIINIYEEDIPVHRRFNYGIDKVPHIICDLQVDDDLFINLHFDKNQLLTGTPTFEIGWQSEAIDKWYNGEWALSHGLQNPIALNAELGWAITCHKAQGSQYNKVLVYENRFPYNREEHARWLYTAATRPIDKLTLVRL